MSGHSKWATIKRKKAKVDAQRGKLFTRLAREIMVAARRGGKDPDGNIQLKTAVQKAKEANIPNENIMRAIQKGAGELGSENYEEFNYEGYGPGGVAVMIEIMTDNRNRTASDIRYLFSRNGGSLGESGCVAWVFQEKGLIVVEKENCKYSEDDLMLLTIETGAEDFKVSDDESYEIIAEPGDMMTVRESLENAGVEIAFAEITKLPLNTVKLEGQEAEQMVKLIDALEEHDDVQNVYTNFDSDMLADM